jgi:hypothetical protein
VSSTRFLVTVNPCPFLQYLHILDVSAWLTLNSEVGVLGVFVASGRVDQVQVAAEAVNFGVL